MNISKMILLRFLVLIMFTNCCTSGEVCLTSNLTSTADKKPENASNTSPNCPLISFAIIPYPCPYVTNQQRADGCLKIYQQFNSTGSINLDLMLEFDAFNPCAISCPLCGNEVPLHKRTGNSKQCIIADEYLDNTRCGPQHICRDGCCHFDLKMPIEIRLPISKENSIYNKMPIGLDGMKSIFNKMLTVSKNTFGFISTKIQDFIFQGLSSNSTIN